MPTTVLMSDLRMYVSPSLCPSVDTNQHGFHWVDFCRFTYGGILFT